MNDRDTGTERFEGDLEESHASDCTCGEDDACDVCGGKTDEEERPVSIDLTRAEAMTLLHVSWEKELEFSSDAETTGLSQIMSSVGMQVGKEVYGPEMTEWLKDRQEERQEMVEEMKERMGGVFDSQGGGTGKVGFQ